MNKEQLVALGLEEEVADKVIEGFGKMIPKHRFDDKNEEVKELKEQLQQRDTQLTELQTQATGNEELQAQIKTLQEQNEQTKTEYQQKLDKKDFDFALIEALRDAKARNPKAVKGLLNIEGIKFEGDQLIGLSEQLDALKQSDDYLFTQGVKGKTPPQGGGAPQVTKEQFNAMTYTEKTKLYNENVELYNQLSE